MITLEMFRELALSLPEAYEEPHFDLPSFRINKKIFATYHAKDHKAMLKFSLIDQSIFCDFDSETFYPVPGGWGAKGATFINLYNVTPEVFEGALKAAFNSIASKNKKQKIKENMIWQ